MPSMSISPPRLSTGTTARISNGPCRLTGADGIETSIETSSRVNFLYLYYCSSAIADGRSCFQVPVSPVSTLTKTSTYKCLILVGSAMPRGVTRPPIFSVSMSLTVVHEHYPPYLAIHPAFRGPVINRIAMEDLGDDCKKGLLFGMTSETCSPYQT
jgi:hypothetical protein